MSGPLPQCQAKKQGETKTNTNKTEPSALCGFACDILPLPPPPGSSAGLSSRSLLSSRPILGVRAVFARAAAPGDVPTAAMTLRGRGTGHGESRGAHEGQLDWWRTMSHHVKKFRLRGPHRTQANAGRISLCVCTLIESCHMHRLQSKINCLEL